MELMSLIDLTKQTMLIKTTRFFRKLQKLLDYGFPVMYNNNKYIHFN